MTEEGLATLAVSSEQRQAAIVQQLSQIDLLNKDQDTAFLIELLGGIFGLLGIGYIYSGLTNAGLARLLAMWLFLFVAWSVAGVLSLILIGLCMMPFIIIAHLAITYFSANELKKGIVAAKAMGAGAGSSASSFGGYLQGGSNEVPLPPMQGTRPEHVDDEF